MAKLTRNGVVGMELTREEIIEARTMIAAIQLKAQCREVNCDIIDALDGVRNSLRGIEHKITTILEEE